MKLLALTESLGPRGGWGTYTAGSVGGDDGVQSRVLMARTAPGAAPRVGAVARLSSRLHVLVRPGPAISNAIHLAHQSRDADLVQYIVEPYATASSPIGSPPSIITVLGTYAISPFREGPLVRILFCAALRCPLAVVSARRRTQCGIFRQSKLDNLRVIHNSNAIDLDGSVDQPTHPIVVDSRPLNPAVGAHKPCNGYHVSLRAVARLRERVPDPGYCLVGELPGQKYAQPRQREISNLRLQYRAVITGPVSGSRPRALYQQADLFLPTPFNSGRSFEGFGIAYPEAKAFGKPLVASSERRAEEVIRDGVVGLTAPEEDVEATADRGGVAMEYPAVYEQALRH